MVEIGLKPTEFIQLNKGGVVRISPEDFLTLRKHTWGVVRNTAGNLYARTTMGGKSVFMHQFLLGKQAGLDIDHRNGDGLDNHRGNLRHVTRQGNSANQRPRRSHMPKGVSKIRLTGRYRAYIAVNYKQIHLGVFETIEEAARAYNTAASKHFGDCARLNPI